MTAQQLEAYLHEQIPLSKAMGVEILESSPRIVRLRAPLGPNLNHHHTAFGGSIATAATLAAWSVLSLALGEAAPSSGLVIMTGQTDYLKPITGDFEALSVIDSEDELERFFGVLKRRGKSKIILGSEVLCDGAQCARFTGTFVASRPVDAP